jgi:glycosyltransferase involved in cell wall biosynthesis
LRERPLRVLGAAAFCVRAQRALRRQAPFSRVQAHFLLPCAWPISTFAFDAASAPALELIGHGSDVRLFCRLPSRLRARIAQAWLSRAARIRVTSAELAQRLHAASPELSRSVHVAASPLDVGQVPTRAAARLALGLDEASQVALIVARLVPAKRVAAALSALSLLDALTVIVVGDGPDLPALRARFPAVRFTGYLPRPEALRFIAAADVLVSASPEEGAPSVVREARALGVRVVAVAAGDLADWAARDSGIFLVR